MLVVAGSALAMVQPAVAQQDSPQTKRVAPAEPSAPDAKSQGDAATKADKSNRAGKTRRQPAPEREPGCPAIGDKLELLV